jgi:hypothetical protein
MELCGGEVTVSFSKYLPLQAMHFLQRSTHFSKTCCIPFAASFRIVEQAVLISWSLRNSLLWSSHFYGLKSPEIAWAEIWTVWGRFYWGSADLGKSTHCHFNRMWFGIVLKEEPFFPENRSFFSLSEIPPKDSGVLGPPSVILLFSLRWHLLPLC